MQYYRDLKEGVIRSSSRILIRSFYVETSTVNAVEVARNHFNSWNRHDADAIVGAFVEGGTYNNPNVDQPLTGAAIGDFAKSVFAAFPDMSLESSLSVIPEEVSSRFSGCCVAPIPGN
jgi:hypothetical protein